MNPTQKEIDFQQLIQARDKKPLNAGEKVLAVLFHEKTPISFCWRQTPQGLTGQTNHQELVAKLFTPDELELLGVNQ